ncbi:MAG: tellurite resistance/C4-dicarboxylate transporter family protein [Bryobacteraceae bacterium]
MTVVSAEESRLATLPPGYFALVMATGIVSLAAKLAGMDAAAYGLLILNVAQYATLTTLTVLRLGRYRDQMLADLRHPARGVSFLTKVAATFVLGSQFAVLTPWLGVAIALWIFGLALWVTLISNFFTVMISSQSKPSMEEGITGAWLIVVVATEGIAVLGCLVAPARAAELVLFVALAAHLAGAMLYAIFITLIVLRWVFFPLDASTLTPAYWINMGALAITTLAGARLIMAAGRWSFLGEILPFLKGIAFSFWATAAWWIPLLVIAGIWRHVVRRVPIAYDPQYWSMVFPLGMFAVATFTLSSAIDMPALAAIGRGFVFVALGCWLATFAGLLRSLVRGTG